MRNFDYIQKEWEWLVQMRLADQDAEQMAREIEQLKQQNINH